MHCTLYFHSLLCGHTSVVFAVSLSVSLVFNQSDLCTIIRELLYSNLRVVWDYLSYWPLLHDITIGDEVRDD